MSNKISVGIYDEHVIALEGVCELISDIDDIQVTLKANTKSQLIENLKTTFIEILIVNIHSVNTPLLNLLMQVNINKPSVKILIISSNNKEEIILRTIKSGAKGFLAKESTKKELIQAIYTLRNGFDFYSNSITHLLVNKYITKLKKEDGIDSSNIKNLSSREIEILQLWGNSYNNAEIAEKLFISVRTVESHKNHIMQKLNLKTTVDLIKFAIRNNIVEL